MAGLGAWPLSRKWRILVTESASGAWNMALDEALWEGVRGGGAPVLRFYTWSPSTLSLGRFQDPRSGLTDQALQVPRVRRSTGGGAIWHADELTYSLACSQEDLGKVGVKASFERLTSFLLSAWTQWGWNPRYAKDAQDSPRPLGVHTPACFSGTEEYDILVDGRKLGGNAQRRDRTTIFQHGSLPLSLDHERLETLFQPGFQPIRTSITDLRTCGWSGTVPELISVLSGEFQKNLGPGEESQVTPQERALARSLERERYGSSDWTENGAGARRISISQTPT